jgi:hypothetical protein
MRHTRAWIAFGLAGWVSTTSAAPKTEPFAATWQVSFRFHDPQRLSLRLPGDSTETTFWYLVYEVTNDTGRDVGFYPSFQLVTDTLQVVEGGADVSPTVYDVVLGRHKVEFPFLAEPSKITGTLLQGRENARSSVVVFREFDRQASGFTIYVAGLSGDLQRVRNPVFDAAREESPENARTFLLRRTLALEYELPGDMVTVYNAQPIRRNRLWVLR